MLDGLAARGDRIKRPVDDHPLALACIGAIAACLSSVAHEAIGHGGTCITVGGRILLLSSVYFRCAGGGALTDAAGPLGNFALAAMCWILLRTKPPATPSLWLLLVLLMAFNGFWGAGYLIYSGILNAGDWAFAARDVFAAGVWQWRPVAVVLGVALYAATLGSVVLTMRTVTPEATDPARRIRRSLRFAYVAAAVSACIAAALFRGSPLVPAGVSNAVREAALEIGIASIGLWFAASRYVAMPQPRIVLAPIAQSRPWTGAGLVIFAAFTATMGRGIL